MEITIKEIGSLAAITRQQNLINNLDGIIQEVLANIARDIVDDAQDMVSILYPPASLPLQPPHLRTGNLQDSIKVLEITENKAIVGALADYAGFLEEGTSKMIQRPFLITAVLSKINEFRDLFFRKNHEVLG